MTRPSGIIQHYNTPKEAMSLWGKKVYSSPKIFVSAFKDWVPVTPYDNHFIYATDVTIRGAPSHMCTCGSAAVIINYENQKTRMFVCLLHAQTGRHTTGT